MTASATANPAPISPVYRSGMLIAGRYRLTRPIGTGGMGSVWVAHSDALQIDVAIKLIRADVTDADAQHRLLREARATARLSDPAIVRVFDAGTTSHGDPYIVMEALDGQDLARCLKQERFDAIRAVRTLVPIVRALGVAHAGGVTHRDIKPDNIFLSRDGRGRIQPKLLDFGIAKLDPKYAPNLTQTGVVMGSPAYMSPEQAQGARVDHRSDLWSACVVLYEMLTGRQPFGADNYNAALFVICNQEPEPTTAQGATSDELWQIVAHGLRKDPDKRWQSAEELLVALSRWLIGQGVRSDVTGVALHDGVGPQSGRRPSLLAEPRRLRPLKRALGALRPSTIAILLLLVGAIAAGWAMRKRPAELDGTTPPKLVPNGGPAANEPAPGQAGASDAKAPRSDASPSSVPTAESPHGPDPQRPGTPHAGAQPAAPSGPARRAGPPPRPSSAPPAGRSSAPLPLSNPFR